MVLLASSPVSAPQTRGESVMKPRTISRRRFLAASAASSAAAIAAPYVHAANAGGSLTIGLWDHWVPGANDVSTALINEWAAHEKVDVKIDYITSQGNKLILTLASEAQARSGHDIMDFNTWEPLQYAASLEPVDDIMSEVVAHNGPVKAAAEYVGKSKGRWVVVPSTRGSLALPACTRFDLLKQHAGIDVTAMYPAGKDPSPEVEKWTWDAFLVAAEKLHKAGYPFGLPLGVTTDSQQWVGALFKSFGADLVDAKGTPTVFSDPVRQVLDYGKRIAAYLPPSVASWDDASNNKWLISGQGALIFNPPSAWAVAKRDAPQVAEKCWTHGMPKGPKGRMVAFLPRFCGIWNFARNKPAAKSLIAWLAMREPAEKLVAASHGYDLPPFAKLQDFRTWDEEEPPKGTLSHYPSKGDQQDVIVCSPSPPSIALQIYNEAIMPKMIVRHWQGEPMEKTLAWAESEVQGYMR
jgi:ABC-type glycerol-3-phosphate transport system substrate-binding protein